MVVLPDATPFQTLRDVFVPHGNREQGSTVEEALANLREAVELFLASASHSEIESRFNPEVIVSWFKATHA